jgi:16S rRNA (uracil1498-N3)-methyltransferase
VCYASKVSAHCVGLNIGAASSLQPANSAGATGCRKWPVPESLEHWLARKPAPGVLRLMLAPARGRSLAKLPGPPAGGSVELLIGAEGGWHPEETQLAALTGFQPVRFGPRILRTETAGLAASGSNPVFVG